MSAEKISAPRRVSSARPAVMFFSSPSSTAKTSVTSSLSPRRLSANRAAVPSESMPGRIRSTAPASSDSGAEVSEDAPPAKLYRVTVCP